MASSGYALPASRSPFQCEEAVRLVLLGFPRPIMSPCLCRAAEQCRVRVFPVGEHNKCIMKAFDVDRKAICEFAGAFAAA
eukprot:7858672-Pyramimonas_sp.AAC.1